MAIPERKAMVIGLDAPIPKSIMRLAQEGHLPTFKRLIDEGVWAEHCLVPHPTITPPNWTTIATGAWPGTHGITCFHLHQPGEPLDRERQAFDSRENQAEFIWEAAERAGKASVVLNYPTTWPPRMKLGVQVAGGGLHVNERRVGPDGRGVVGWETYHSVGNEQLISVAEVPLADVVTLSPDEEAAAKISAAARVLSTPVRLAHRDSSEPVRPQEWQLYVVDSGSGFDRVLLSRSGDPAAPDADLQVGEWSPTIKASFEAAEEPPIEAAFRAKLIELSLDAKRLRLYVTPISRLAVQSYPEEIGAELATLDVLPLRAWEQALHLQWIDFDTYAEVIDMENEYLAAAGVHLMQTRPWTLFYMHAHAPDHTYHYSMSRQDPLTCDDPKTVEECQRLERLFYESLDRMVALLLEAADENTVVVIVSDHGATPSERRFKPGAKGFSVQEVLAQKGYTVFREDRETGQRVIDWSRTRAVAQRSCYVYLNVAGRDPEGIVQPGEEYESLVREIIEALTDYREPATGRKPIVFALSRRDARILGLYSDRVGDIVYGVHPEVWGEHGRQITTGEYGSGEMKGLLMLSGPNIRKGCKLERTAWLTDVVPTVCTLLGLPMPAQAEGAVLYQALEDPDELLHQYDQLQRNYQRVKDALQGQQALTHSYE